MCTYNELVTLPGEHALTTLFRTLQPMLHPDEFVFCTIANSSKMPGDFPYQAAIREVEGLTLILTRAEAERRGLNYIFPCRMITLNVHSALDAIGFLAAITQILETRGISTNVVAGYYHDHLFVALEHADAAMKALCELSASGPA